MISCHEAEELISAQLDGALSASEQGELAAHLAQCASCRALQGELQALHDAMLAAAAHWTAEPPADLTRRVMERIHGEAVTPLPQKARPVWKRWAPLAAVLALVVIGGGVLGLWRGGASGGGTSGSSSGGAMPEAAAFTEAAGAPAGQADYPDPEDNGAGRMTADTNAAKEGDTQTPGAVPAADGVQGGIPEVCLSAARPEGVYLALDLAYEELGGDSSWQRTPLEDPDLVGYTLTPAGTSEETALLLFQAEPAGETLVYQFRYYSGGVAAVSNEYAETAAYTLITVDLAQNAVSWNEAEADSDPAG